MKSNETPTRVLLTIFAAISLPLFLSSCAILHSGDAGKPRKDPRSKTGYYIPRNLDDALVEVDRIMGSNGRDDVMKDTQDGMIRYHMGLGMWMRNNWGLWGGSRLAQYFSDLGIEHPDDMSGIILDSYWRKLHGKPVDVEGQVRHYQDYWKSAKKDVGG